jgi:1,4-dihydroxy-2-naphthoate octaprenyltransferase
MQTLGALLRAARPLAHANIAPPILYGQALAWALTGSFTWRAFFAAQAFGVLDHLFVVFSNDWADRDSDSRNQTFNAFSGGSRVLQEGALRPQTLLQLAILAAVLLVTLSIGLAPSRPYFPVFAAAAIVLLFAYSHAPLRLSYRGGGEWLQAFGVGVVLPLVGFHAQVDGLRRTPWLALVPTLVLGLAGNVLTSLPDEPSDRETGKNTWAVRREHRAPRDVLLLAALGVLLGAALVPIREPVVRVAVAVVPLALLALALPFLRRADPDEPRPLFFFMLAVGAASTAAIVGWAIALATQR